MAINDEIAAGVRPIQFENPLNNMVKFSNIQNDMANMALHKQKMEAATAAAARKNELYNYLGSGGRDPNRIFELGGHEELNQIRQGDTAEKLGKKTTAETDKIHDDTASQAYRNISQNPSPENIIAHNQDYQLNPNNSPERKARSQRTADMLVAMPLDQRVAYLASQGASAADLKQRIGTVNAGGSTVTTSTDPYSGKTMQVGEVAHTLTPEQELNAVPGQAKLVAEYNQTAAAIQGLLAKANDPANAGQAAQLLADAKDLSNSNELRGEAIKGMQGQAAQGKHAASGDMQLVNELSMLEANGQGKSPRATHVRALLAKQEHIAETESYTDAGLALAAEMVRNGVVPPRGGKGAINAAAAAGVTAPDYVAGKGNLAGIQQISRQEAPIAAFEKTFTKNAAATLDLGRKITKTGVPIMDQWIANPLNRASGNNPELAAFDVLLKGTLNEYGKLVSGATGSTAVAQAEIKRIEKLLNAAQTVPQLENAIGAMNLETANRMYGFKAQKAEMLGKPAPAAPVNKFNLETREVMVNGVKVKAVKGEDGKWYPK